MDLSDHIKIPPLRDTVLSVFYPSNEPRPLEGTTFVSLQPAIKQPALIIFAQVIRVGKKIIEYQLTR